MKNVLNVEIVLGFCYIMLHICCYYYYYYYYLFYFFFQCMHARGSYLYFPYK